MTTRILIVYLRQNFNKIYHSRMIVSQKAPDVFPTDWKGSLILKNSCPISINYLDRNFYGKCAPMAFGTFNFDNTSVRFHNRSAYG